MRPEESPLLSIQQQKKPQALSKSFMLILIASCVVLLGASITLGFLYYNAENKIDNYYNPDNTPAVVAGDGILVLNNFSQLANHRVGLITAPTAIVNNVHIIDRMHFTPNEFNMTLVALFGAEHGLRGNEPAGMAVPNYVDERTGLPVYSLYGNFSQLAPTPQMLEDITALVYDIQDVGARYYTFISTLGLCMQAAAEHNKTFFVLDRPNPIGAMDQQVSGWTLDQSNASLIGLYSIPIQYSLTTGELALMIKGEKLLPGLEGLDLQVLQMTGYTRDMIWTDTKLPWISPSPNLLDLNAAMLYPGTCFFEAFYLVTEGRGTLLPFEQIGATWVDKNMIAQNLNSFNLPGVRFYPSEFVPVNISGMAVNPKFAQQNVQGVIVQVTDPYALRAVELGIYMSHMFYDIANETMIPLLLNHNSLDLHAGTPLFGQQLANDTPPQQVISSWSDDVNTFLQIRKNYLIYPVGPHSRW